MVIAIGTLLFCAWAAWIWARYSRKETIDPRCLLAIDGDTVWLLDHDRTVVERFRLENINAPELRRARSRAELNRAVDATAFLRDRISAASSATIRRRGKDRYGRTLVRLKLDRQDAGRMLLRARLARRWS